MASFNGRVETFQVPPNPASLYIRRPAGTNMIPDAVYKMGAPVTITSSTAADIRTTFYGYEESTGNPVFYRPDAQSYIILIPERPSGRSYMPGTIITDEPFEVGDATFSNYGVHIGDGRYHLQGSEIKFEQGVYEEGNPLVFEVQGTILGVTYVGHERGTGYPVFQIETTRYIAINSNAPAGTIYTVGDIITDMSYTTCFAPGTLIATSHGERAVETLKPGDRVLTADGDTVPVRFVGFQKVPTLFGPKEFTRPVRIRAGALGKNTPHTDLIVTKDHGMIVDGVICHAGALINGTSIVEVQTRELDIDPSGIVTYYHVETENHVPLLANGAVAESFIDNVDRAIFANHSEFVGMYGARVPAMTEMNLPRAMSMRQVPQGIQTRLDKRAAVILAPSWVRRLWGACFRGLRVKEACGWARSVGRRLVAS